MDREQKKPKITNKQTSKETNKLKTKKGKKKITCKTVYVFLS